jgi:hypothetical protein
MFSYKEFEEKIEYMLNGNHEAMVWLEKNLNEFKEEHIQKILNLLYCDAKKNTPDVVGNIFYLKAKLINDKQKTEEYFNLARQVYSLTIEANKASEEIMLAIQQRMKTNSFPSSRDKLTRLKNDMSPMIDSMKNLLLHGLSPDSSHFPQDKFLQKLQAVMENNLPLEEFLRHIDFFLKIIAKNQLNSSQKSTILQIKEDGLSLIKLRNLCILQAHIHLSKDNSATYRQLLSAAYNYEPLIFSMSDNITKQPDTKGKPAEIDEEKFLNSSNFAEERNTKKRAGWWVKNLTFFPNYKEQNDETEMTTIRIHRDSEALSFETEEQHANEESNNYDLAITQLTDIYMSYSSVALSSPLLEMIKEIQKLYEAYDTNLTIIQNLTYLINQIISLITSEDKSGIYEQCNETAAKIVELMSTNNKHENSDNFSSKNNPSIHNFLPLLFNLNEALMNNQNVEISTTMKCG